MEQIEQIIPYNGDHGYYKLTIDGHMKSVIISWKYNQNHPEEMMDMKIYKEGLNPLQIQKIEELKYEHGERWKEDKGYYYLLNLTTAIYQECMMGIKEFTEEDKLEGQEIR